MFVKGQISACVLANLAVYNSVDKVVDNSLLGPRSCG